MKKLIVCTAIVCAAAVSHAAAFSWTTSGKLYGVVAADVTGNGIYSVATSGTTDRGDKVLSLSYVLTILDASTDSVVGSASGTVGYGTLGRVATTIDVASAEAGTTYKYVLALTGTQSNLSGRGTETDYDYSAASLETQLSGTITTATMGDTGLDIVPSSWTVSGITEVGGTGGGVIPEPTSGLLLLIGGSLLALRRKQK